MADIDLWKHITTYLNMNQQSIFTKHKHILVFEITAYGTIIKHSQKQYNWMLHHARLQTYILNYYTTTCKSFGKYFPKQTQTKKYLKHLRRLHIAGFYMDILQVNIQGFRHHHDGPARWTHGFYVHFRCHVESSDCCSICRIHLKAGEELTTPWSGILEWDFGCSY